MKFLAPLAVMCAGWVSAGATEWQPVTWHGEPAFASASAGWRAVVSVTRGRLMHFGPDGQDTNLLLAPATRANRNRLGGHRLWLGPQTSWKGFWPPASAWEYEEPAKVTSEGGLLRFVMPESPDGWPRLTRTYHWAGAELICGAEASGGTRPAQFIHILQVPASMEVKTEVHPESDFPAGYVRLTSTAGPFATRFAPPPHATLAGSTLTLRHTGAVGKFGFRPQPLIGTLGGFSLRVARGTQTGAVVGEPDEGFHTQVYLSEEHEAFVELEELSPLFAPGSPARFELVLSGARL
ncbi:hypothetical protein Verru16b_01164 [Lacunisphaera limnophila]|uniref:DUF4380 domain-containing protein n=1 Tax=Lacunisphaera limnophila TaxID=1838286 RepID=A0A1D8AT89_9BACT|nr:hypothetical protein [Lacunisphaera limnophila]AOS44103.1 hypothetical protein Verru16b_01164 [Lacunisphaera limnophila]